MPNAPIRAIVDEKQEIRSGDTKYEHGTFFSLMMEDFIELMQYATRY